MGSTSSLKKPISKQWWFWPAVILLTLALGRMVIRYYDATTYPESRFNSPADVKK